MRIAIVPVFLLVASQLRATDRLATSASLAAVQAQVDVAVNGDTVLIPNGSATWNAPLNIGGKRIIIRAQNITPATTLGTGGSMPARNVVITNASASTLMSFTTGNDFHCGVGGIRINEGSGVGNYITVTGSGTKPMLIWDCYFEVKNRFGDPPNACIIRHTALGGVMWNTWIQGVGPGSGGQDFPEGASVQVFSPRAWTTDSTMGTLDTGGLVNFYIENCRWQDFGQSPDIDDNGRVVVRYSTFDGTSGLTHGFSSPTGGRHVEYYHNDMKSTSSNRNIAGRAFWLRAGTILFTDNTVNVPYQGYGDPMLLDVGDENHPAGTYPINRAPGQGYSGGSHVSDPIYIWNNTGTDATNWNHHDLFWVPQVVLGRDIFVNSGAKPGYTQFTHPHPLRAAVQAVTDTTPPTVTSAAINAAGDRFTLNASETVSIGTGGNGGMTISASGGAVTLTFVPGESGPTSLVYSTSRNILTGETITRTYVQPGNGIEDTAGNDLASFSAQAVTNSVTGDVTAPVPTPMSFSSQPVATTSFSITMTASLASDAGSPPVQYYFDETSGNPGGTDSGWQSERTYTNNGLNPGIQYTYRVLARDSAAVPNQTTQSPAVNVTTPIIAGGKVITPAKTIGAAFAQP